MSVIATLPAMDPVLVLPGLRDTLYTDSAGTTSYTFNINTNAAGPTRTMRLYLLAAVRTASGAVQITGLTVNGSAATLINRTASATLTASAIYYADIPTGTAVTVVVTASATTRVGMLVTYGGETVNAYHAGDSVVGNLAGTAADVEYPATNMEPRKVLTLGWAVTSVWATSSITVGAGVGPLATGNALLNGNITYQLSGAYGLVYSYYQSKPKAGVTNSASGQVAYVFAGIY